MLFAPATAKSAKIRSLYALIYIVLILGAVTMIAPFLIMLSGSVEPRAQTSETLFFPAYLVNDDALWERYLETRYQGLNELLRMNWDDATAKFRGISKAPQPQKTPGLVPLWKEFLAESPMPEEFFSMGFMRPSVRMPSFTNMVFRPWLIEKFGSLEGVNRALGTSYSRRTEIIPPLIRMDSPPLPQTPLVREFFAFSASQPPERKFAWNVGAFYRANVVPRVVGNDIATYNERFGTHYTSFTEIPFPATVPEIGAEPWVFFVTRLLRTDFVQLSPAGIERMKGLNLGKVEFIRTRANPEELIVVSADTKFARWAAERGIADARIPQREIDEESFAKDKGFWKAQFVTLNYRYVLDEISGHGGAIRNTVILIVLSITGTLLVNPLAAYALSRYKIKSSYHILLFCLATIAFPAEVTMIPVFLQLREFNLLNTFGALVLPGLANGFSIFLLKGFFDSLPRELYEAAEIEGAGEWVTWWYISMNLSKPILAVIALDVFVGAYGSFFYALILAPDPAIWTLMVYIYQLRQGVAPPVVYASLIITAVPTLIIFVACQGIILRGIVVPSEK
ncbi:MAG: carbohydrate ABC transporter permease [Verrucomicrobiota bacterium]